MVGRAPGSRPRAPRASAWKVTPCAYPQQSTVKQGWAIESIKFRLATDCRGPRVGLSPKVVPKNENRRP
eukprot:scaffold20316_cov66-Phaeocystis_antarctica.AAC.1